MLYHARISRGRSARKKENEGERYALATLFLLPSCVRICAQSGKQNRFRVADDDDFTAVGENYAKEKVG